MECRGTPLFWARIEVVRQAHGPKRGRGSKEYYLYFEHFEPKPGSEFGRHPKFCGGLKILKRSWQ